MKSLTPPAKTSTTSLGGHDHKLLSRHDVLVNNPRPKWATGGTPLAGRRRPAENRKLEWENREVDSLSALDELAIAAWLTDGDGRVDDCNATACELMGVKDKSKLIGVMLSSSVVVKHKERVRKAINGASRGRQTDDFSVSMLTIKGEECVEVAVSASTTPRRDGSDVTGSLVMTREIDGTPGDPNDDLLREVEILRLEVSRLKAMYEPHGAGTVPSMDRRGRGLLQALGRVMAAWMRGTLRGCVFNLRLNAVEASVKLEAVAIGMSAGERRLVACRIMSRVMMDWMGATLRACYFTMKNAHRKHLNATIRKDKGLQVLVKGRVLVDWLRGTIRGAFFAMKFSFNNQRSSLSRKVGALRALTRVLARWLSSTVRGCVFRWALSSCRRTLWEDNDDEAMEEIKKELMRRDDEVGLTLHAVAGAIPRCISFNTQEDNAVKLLELLHESHFEHFDGLTGTESDQLESIQHTLAQFNALVRSHVEQLTHMKANWMRKPPVKWEYEYPPRTNTFEPIPNDIEALVEETCLEEKDRLSLSFVPIFSDEKEDFAFDIKTRQLIRMSTGTPYKLRRMQGVTHYVAVHTDGFNLIPVDEYNARIHSSPHAEEQRLRRLKIDNKTVCGNVFRDDAKYCRKCGSARVGAGRLCPGEAYQPEKGDEQEGETRAHQCHCGNIFVADASFCRKCGFQRPVADA